MLRRQASSALRAAARASRPQLPPSFPRGGASGFAPLRGCSGAALSAAAAGAPAKTLLTLAALKRALALAAGGSTLTAAALSYQRPTYVLPPDALAELALSKRKQATLAELLPRGCQLALLFSPLALLAPLATLLPSARALFYRLLTWTLARAGCAFIKWGQWAAVRPDLFPPDMARARPCSGAPSPLVATLSLSVARVWRRLPRRSAAGHDGTGSGRPLAPAGGVSCSGGLVF